MTVADDFILSAPGGGTMNNSPPRSVMMCGCSSAHINAARMFAGSGTTYIVGLRDRRALLANRPHTRGHVRNRNLFEFIRPCSPTKAKTVPATEVWLHEPKRDGYRLQVIKEGSHLLRYSRRGNRTPVGLAAAL